MDSDFRSRHLTTIASKEANNESKVSALSHPQLSTAEASPRISIFDILRLLTGLLLLSSTLSYFITGNSVLWGYRPAYTRPARVRAWLRGPISLSDAELRAFDGSDPKLPIYVALNGSIYDVSVSPHFYGPGGSYHFFAGRDATRAYVTGCFEEDLTPDLRGVEEMFVPFEADEGVGGKPGETKEEKKERKLRRERELRVARKKVGDTVKGWQKMFDGGKEGRYFKVGSVRREEGWEESLGPVRELCKKAREGRPKRDTS